MYIYIFSYTKTKIFFEVMAAIMPNVPGTGNNIPISTYVPGITESYPNVNRQRIVEASINSKECVDFMPVNMSTNQTLSDKYLEYRINGIAESFLDLTSLFMELDLKIKKNLMAVVWGWNKPSDL